MEAFELADIMALVGTGPTKLSLVRASPGFFTYEPILRCLQTLEELPLAEELVHDRPPGPASYLANVDVKKEIEGLQQSDGFTYDPSQVEAFRLALRTATPSPSDPRAPGRPTSAFASPISSIDRPRNASSS